MDAVKSAKLSHEEPDAKWITLVRRFVASMQFGEVQIVVHNGHVVQIETTEKVRLDQGRKHLRSGATVRGINKT